MAEDYAVAGGDIKNAVLKAAQMASAEPGPDADKKIHQRHFVAGIEEVIASKRVMEQSIIDGDGSARPMMDQNVMAGISAAFEQLAQNDRAMGEDLKSTIERAEVVEAQVASIPEILGRFEEAGTTARVAIRDELAARIDRIGAELNDKFADIKSDLARGDERGLAVGSRINLALTLGALGLLVGFGAIIVALVTR